MSATQETRQPQDSLRDSAIRSGADCIVTGTDTDLEESSNAIKALRSSLHSVTQSSDQIEETEDQKKAIKPVTGGNGGESFPLQESQTVNIGRKRAREDEYKEIIKEQKVKIDQLTGTVKKLRQDLRQESKELHSEKAENRILRSRLKLLNSNDMDMEHGHQFQEASDMPTSEFRGILREGFHPRPNTHQQQHHFD